MKQFDYFEARYDSGLVEICLANPMLFDVTQFAELRDELIEFVDNFRPRKLLVNFSNVRYCATAVMNSLLLTKERLDTYGGQMKFCGMNEAVRDSFVRLDLDGRVFDIYSTTAAALDEF